ncbi:hypothetical protein EBZ02_07510 [bacterium]|nr:hypothetical protein [bacterium]
MKQGRAVEPGESLQLLVDPMCNLFAGLVLLSVFLALFAGRNQGAPTKESAESGRFANQELLQKRSAETRDAIAEIRAANETLASRLGTGAVLPPLEAVEKAVAEADEATRGEAVISCKTLQQALESELENLQGELVSLTNEAEGLKKETARLQERQEKLSRQKAAGTDGNQEVTLRIPRARPTDKTPVYLLLSGGKVFPAQLPSGLEDDAHVERQRSPSEDRIFPKSGRGNSFPPTAAIPFWSSIRIPLPNTQRYEGLWRNSNSALDGSRGKAGLPSGFRRGVLSRRPNEHQAQGLGLSAGFLSGVLAPCPRGSPA